jgi:hypothetical protein
VAEIFQDLGCGFALRQAQQATAFLGLKTAIPCVVHIISFEQMGPMTAHYVQFLK